MSKSGMGYLLGSFRFSSASDLGHQDNNGWGGYGVLAHIIHDGSSAPLPHPPHNHMGMVRGASQLAGGLSQQRIGDCSRSVHG